MVTSQLGPIFHDLYLPFLRQYKGVVAGYGIVLCTLYLVQPILLPNVLNRVLDDVAVHPSAPMRLRHDIRRVVMLLSFIALLGYVKNTFDAFLPTRQFQWIRQQLYERLLRLLETRLHAVRVGEFITLVNYLPREIRYLSENAIHLLPVVLGMGFLTVYSAWIDRRAGLVFLLGMIVNVWLLTGSPLVQGLIRQSRQRAAQMLTNNSRLSEEIQLLDHIYANNQVREMLQENSHRETSLRSIFETSVKTSNLIVLLLFIWNTVLMGICMLLVYRRDASPRRFRFRSYALILSFFLMMLWNNLSRFMTFIMAAESVSVYYEAYQAMVDQNREQDTPIESTSPPPRTDATTPPAIQDTSIVFDRLSFRYSPDTPWIIRHLEWSIRPGSRWVLTGPSGKGKSTLYKLLLRLLQPTEGTILLGDRPLGDYRIEDVRHVFCLVHQETALFERSIGENIAFGNDGLSRQAVIEAFRRYDLVRNFQRFPEETIDDILDRSCGIDGRDLSKGQQKIVIIARSLFRSDRAQIYLMDEPLASLDRRTQENVIRWIEDTVAGSTLLLTTHIVDHRLFDRFQIRSL